MTNAIEQKKEIRDAYSIRQDFPVLGQKIHGHPLVYLDSAASAQKPLSVIDEIRRFYLEDYSNIHRGVYELSQRSTDAFEAAREKVTKFLNAKQSKEIIFTSGTTGAINLVAQSFGRERLGPGDEVLVSLMEHHSNIVPWQFLCKEQGATLKVVPIDDHGALDMNAFAELLTDRTRIVAITHQSNALGTVNPIREITAQAHARNIPVLVDGAQAAVHSPVDVQELGCDFYALSGHKLYGPSGIGILYGKAEHLDTMPPWQGGGEMIRSVTFEETTFNDAPHKFEAGTPNIAGAVGLGAAIDYLTELGMENVAAAERELFAYAETALAAVDGLRFIGTAKTRASVLSFVLGDVHPHDIGTIIDREGIAVRTGHHCAQPVMKRFDVPATVRASLAVYNTREDIDALVDSLRKAQEMFR